MPSAKAFFIGIVKILGGGLVLLLLYLLGTGTLGEVIDVIRAFFR